MKLALAVALIAVIFISASAAALAEPKVTVIPSRLSPGASFLAIAEGELEKPVRIRWVVLDSMGSYGQFPRIGDNFYCYFSNGDPEAFCGPNPFNRFTGSGIEYLPDSYRMDVDIWDADGGTVLSNATVEVGNIVITPVITVDEESGKVSMQISTLSNGIGVPSTVTYDVLDRNNLSTVTGGFKEIPLSPSGFYMGNFTLQGGDYFLAISASTDNDYGGGIYAISIPAAVGGSCSAPGSPGSYPLVADEVSLPGLFLNSGGTFEKSDFRVSNVGDSLLGNLTVAVPPAFSTFMSITLSTSTLDVNGTTFFSLKLFGINDVKKISTVADILSNGEIVGKIPISIYVSLGGSQQCPSTGSGDLVISSSIWVSDFLTGQAKEKSFTLTNNGDVELSDISYDVSPGLSGVTVTLPASIPAGGTGSMLISISPTSSGNFDGTVKVDSEVGSVSVLIAGDAFSDITGDISTAEDDLAFLRSQLSESQLLALDSRLAGIEGLLSLAGNSFDSGNYAEAEKSLAEAEASISSVGDVASFTSGGSSSSDGLGIDPTLILIPGAVVIVVLVLIIFIRKKRASQPEDDEIDEDLDEEFGP